MNTGHNAEEMWRNAQKCFDSNALNHAILLYLTLVGIPRMRTHTCEYEAQQTIAHEEEYVIILSMEIFEQDECMHVFKHVEI